MSLAWMPAAFASSPSSANLTLSNTNTGTSGVTATNSFVATSGIPAGDTITISSLAASGSPETLSTVPADYTVTCSPSCNTPGQSSNTILASTLSTSQAQLTVTTAVASGATVTVTIAKSASGTGVTNPSTASSVYFADSTTSDSTPVDTNAVAITAPPPPSTPAVTSVNPTALNNADTTQPFTVTGTNFSAIASGGTTYTPLVCLVPAAATPPAASSFGSTYPAASCGTETVSGTTYTNLMAANVSVNSTGTELQATNPGTASAQNPYNVVVYNYNPSASDYVGPNSTSAATEVTEVTHLNFVPESGVRVADSRVGFNLPTGPIASGTTVPIPFSDLANSLSLPDNLPPGEVTALDFNVTAVAPSGPGNLQIYSVASGTSCGATPATNSNGTLKPATVNFQPPEDTSNYTILPLAAASSGSICIADNGASVNVVIDLTGFETDLLNSNGSIAFAGDQYRMVDSRNGTGGLLGPLSGNTVYQVTLGTYQGVDVAGKTIALNVAAVAPTAVGNLRVFPATGSPATCPTSASGVPNTAVDNYIPGTDSSSFYIMSVPADGNICLYSNTAGTVNVVLDLYGVVSSENVVALTSPYRVYDSRPGGIASGQTVNVTASPSGSGTIFTPSGVVATIGSLSDIDPSAVGNLRTFPQGDPLPNTASIPNYPNQIRENLIISALNPSNGEFSIYSDGAMTNSTFDASAYITNG